MVNAVSTSQSRSELSVSTNNRPKVPALKWSEGWCGHCKTVKPREEFSKNKRTKRGIAAWCKDCNREASYKSAKAKREAMTPEELAAFNEARRRKYKEKQELSTGPYWKDINELKRWIETL